ncbi:hypothetical protein ACFX19_027753 [Malus domestica]
MGRLKLAFNYSLLTRMDLAANQLSLKSHSISTRRSIDAPIIQKIYPWPEADKSKLIRSLSVACSASPSTNNLQYEGLAFRKSFLGSYPFCKKEPTPSFAKRIKNGSRAT